MKLSCERCRQLAWSSPTSLVVILRQRPCIPRFSPGARCVGACTCKNYSFRESVRELNEKNWIPENPRRCFLYGGYISNTGLRLFVKIMSGRVIERQYLSTFHIQSLFLSLSFFLLITCFVCTKKNYHEAERISHVHFFCSNASASQFALVFSDLLLIKFSIRELVRRFASSAAYMKYFHE